MVGDDDVAAGTVGVNPRGGEVERDVPVAVFAKRLADEVDLDGPVVDTAAAAPI